MLTRLARHLTLVALLGCAAHHAAPAAAPVCAAPKTDSLHIDVTERTDSGTAARMRPCGADGWPAIVHLIDPRAARDAIDSGVDVLVTADPATVAYAATRPDYESAPLAWNRLYLLVLPKGRGATGGGEALRVDLATNAVRVDARPAQSHGCGAVAPVIGPGSRGRIVYAEGDSVARALAERLVALAPRPGFLAPLTLALDDDTLQARGIPADSLPAAVADGQDAGYIVSTPFPVLSPPCPDAPGILPLIETRAHAIVRRASP
jgi:hypothetical protein